MRNEDCELETKKEGTKEGGIDFKLRGFCRINTLRGFSAFKTSLKVTIYACSIPLDHFNIIWRIEQLEDTITIKLQYLQTFKNLP